MHATLAPTHRAPLRTAHRPAARRPRHHIPRAAPASLDVDLLNAQEAVERADFL